MRIQSAGTGLVDGAFFSFLGEPLDVAVDAAGLGVELVLAGALAAGLDPQPAAISASAHTKNTYFFINPPNKFLSWKSDLTNQAGKALPGYLTKLQEISTTWFLKSAATLNETEAISQK
jgi:uncharacterized membrane protein YphA (DoxX/SURF4 family)